MTWNGNGVVLPPGSPEFPAIPGDVIRAEYFNAVIQALCDDFLNAMPRDGQVPMTGNLDLANLFRIVNMPPAVALGQAVRYDEFQALQTAVNGLAGSVEPFIYYNAGII